MFNRAECVDAQLRDFLESHMPQDPPQPLQALEPQAAIELFESQLTSRWLDLVAREMRAKGTSYYTIGSAGHEGNALVGRLTRPTDPAMLHYRSGAFVAERFRQTGEDMVLNTMLSVAASRDEPIAGGRHKVWGSRQSWIVPQTSTIASQLPKAVGAAIALGRAKRLDARIDIPYDSIVVCSFGDASTNHSTAQGALNAAAYAGYQRIPVPLLFVCEDNGLGISVPTAKNWIAASMKDRVGIKYVHADGLNLDAAFPVVQQAITYCRERRTPVFLHLSVIRMLGHAGSDLEASYRDLQTIEATEARDPLLTSARLLLDAGITTRSALRDMYTSIGDRVRLAGNNAANKPKLSSAKEIVAPLAPYDEAAVEEQVRCASSQGNTYSDRKHMAIQINRALREAMIQYPHLALFGEDVAHKGGVYHVTAGLLEAFGTARVFNTLLDEQTILGLAQGFGLVGMLPCPEIQYLAYIHNAIDQIRGEACSLQFFSCNQFKNPMVVRIASFGYQKGFGGHFHNDNSIASLREIPGLIICAPSRGDDAAAMLRTAFSVAQTCGRVVAFLEPIALYMTRDLHDDGDGLWLTEYPSANHVINLGDCGLYYPEANDLLIVSYANGLYMSLRAAKLLQEQTGKRARVVDLRWLNPLNTDLIRKHAHDVPSVLVVDEGRRTGGIAEAIITAISETPTAGYKNVHPKIARVCGEDSYIPLGPAANYILPTEDTILRAARSLLDC